MVVSNSYFRMLPKIIWVSWNIWASVSKFWRRSSSFNNGNNQNCTVWGLGCMVDLSSLQCHGTEATLAQELWRIHHRRSLGHFYWIRWSLSSTILWYSLFNHVLESDMLIHHPVAIKEGDQYHFARWLLLTNPFHPRFTTMEPHLWLTFRFRIVMMNPGFVNSDDAREKVCVLGDLCQIFQTYWTATLYSELFC